VQSLARVAPTGAAAIGVQSGERARSRSTRPAPRRRLPLRERAAELAHARGPLRFGLATVAARLVERRGWERLGFARLDDYARERVGHSGRSLYDLARGHRKLKQLPRLRRALLSGELTWTKVRLAARVATAQDEEAWARVALGSSADTLEKLVRQVDRGSLEAGGALGAGAPRVDPESTEPRERFWPGRCTPTVHAKWFRTRRAANRVAGQTCPPSVALEMVVAEVLSLVPLEDTGEANAESPSDSSAHVVPAWPPPSPSGAASRLCRSQSAEAELPVRVAALLAGLDQADAAELDRRLRALVALEQQLDARIGALLAEVARSRAHRRLGHRSLAGFAREQLSISPSKARALLRLERAARASPELARGYREGRLSWSKAQALLPLLLREGPTGFRSAWVRWAEQVTQRRLEDDAARALLLFETDRALWTESGGLPEEALSEDSQIRAKPTVRGGSTQEPETSRLLLGAPRSVARLARAALCTVRRRIERLVGRPVSPSEGFEAMLDHALEAWGHPHTRVKKEHRVFERDGWRCAVPGCSSYRSLHAHHVVPRARGGSNAAWNLVTLCAFHHLRGVHAGIIGLEGRAPDELRFELPWGRFRSGDVAMA